MQCRSGALAAIESSGEHYRGEGAAPTEPGLPGESRG